MLSPVPTPVAALFSDVWASFLYSPPGFYVMSDPVLSGNSGPAHVLLAWSCALFIHLYSDYFWGFTFQRGNLIGTKGLLKSFRSVIIEEKKKKERNNTNLLLASRSEVGGTLSAALILSWPLKCRVELNYFSLKEASHFLNCKLLSFGLAKQSQACKTKPGVVMVVVVVHAFDHNTPGAGGSLWVWG